jgi:hypothetical protein
MIYFGAVSRREVELDDLPGNAIAVTWSVPISHVPTTSAVLTDWRYEAASWLSFEKAYRRESPLKLRVPT